MITITKLQQLEQVVEQKLLNCELCLIFQRKAESLQYKSMEDAPLSIEFVENAREYLLQMQFVELSLDFSSCFNIFDQKGIADPVSLLDRQVNEIIRDFLRIQKVKIVEVNLSFNKVGDGLFDVDMVSALKNLKVLILDFTQVRNISQKLINFQLQQLSIMGTQVGDELAFSFEKLIDKENFRKLCVCGTNLRIRGVHKISNVMFRMQNVRSLDFQSISLADSGVPSSDFLKYFVEFMENLFKMQLLEELNLSGIPIQEQAIQAVSNVYFQLISVKSGQQHIQLKILKLNNCDLRETALHLIDQLFQCNKCLELLELRNNQFVGKDLFKLNDLAVKLHDRKFYIDCTWNKYVAELAQQKSPSISFFPYRDYKIKSEDCCSHRKVVFQVTEQEFNTYVNNVNFPLLSAEKTWEQNAKLFNFGQKQTQLVDLAPVTKELLQQMYQEKNKQLDSLEQKSPSFDTEDEVSGKGSVRLTSEQGSLSFDVDVAAVQQVAESKAEKQMTDVDFYDFLDGFGKSIEQTIVVNEQVSKPKFRSNNHNLNFDETAMDAAQRETKQQIINAEEQFVKDNRESLSDISKLVQFRGVNSFYTKLRFKAAIPFSILNIVETKQQVLADKLKYFQSTAFQPLAVQTLEQKVQVSLQNVFNPDEFYKTIEEGQAQHAIVCLIEQRYINERGELERRKIALPRNHDVQMRVDKLGVLFFDRDLLSNKTNQYFLFFDGSFSYQDTESHTEEVQKLMGINEDDAPKNQELTEEQYRERIQKHFVFEDGSQTVYVTFLSSDYETMLTQLLVAMHNERRIKADADEGAWVQSALCQLEV